MLDIPFFGDNSYVAHNGRFYSQRQLDLANEIEARYPNLMLAWIPPEDRGPEDQGREFAIIDTYDNDTPVLRLSEDQCEASFVLKWLWDNDGTREGNSAVDRLAKLEEETARERKSKIEDQALKEADVISTIAKSGKNYFKHDGQNISDNPSVLKELLYGN